MYEAEAEIHRALGDPHRLRILGLLRAREACVCELVDLLPISQPAVSQHLRRLRQAGLVRERRQSYWTYYAISADLPPHLAAVIQSLPQDEAAETLLRAKGASEVCPPRPDDADRRAVATVPEADAGH